MSSDPTLKGVAILLALFVAPVQSVPVAQRAEAPAVAPDPWYSRSSRARDFEVPKGLLGKFTIELPKDWQIVPGYGGVVFTAAEKTRSNQSGADIVLERMELGGPLEPKDLTPTFANAEMSAMRERQPGGQGFTQQLKDADGRRFILIQYTKPGWAGLDSVVQYSIPAGAVMYRLICIAPEAQLLAKYQPIFAHVAVTFKAS